MASLSKEITDNILVYFSLIFFFSPGHLLFFNMSVFMLHAYLLISLYLALIYLLL